MGIYQKYVLPRLINLAMRNKAARVERAKFIPLAAGAVLEVGFGSGLNLPFYGPNVEKLYALDPSPEMWRLAAGRARGARFPIELIPSPAEHLPLDDTMVDTVVSTWTLCTIPDPGTALREMKRVLKPGGQLIFVEHGRSPDRRVLAWQDRLNPLWTRIGGGCNLNRNIEELVADAGFRITQIEKSYAKGLKPFTYFYKGLAYPHG